MPPSSHRLVFSFLAVTIIAGFSLSLLSCASLGPVTLVAVADLKAVSGTWRGILYLTGSERSDVTLTIGDDGSYDVVWTKNLGASRGKGRVVISDGRLVLEGARGLRGVGTVLQNPAGDVLMKIEATLSDNSNLSAELWPTN
jgi:hypothetical protein